MRISSTRPLRRFFRVAILKEKLSAISGIICIGFREHVNEVKNELVATLQKVDFDIQLINLMSDVRAKADGKT